MCVENDVRVEMRAGIGVRARIYRSADRDQHPAILLRSYDASKYAGNFLSLLTDLVGADYAFVSSNVRGRLGSEGEWKPEHNETVEGPDGYARWNGSRGSRGARATWDCSASPTMGAFTVFAAMEQPPHLRAIAPWTTDFGMGAFIPARTGGVTSFFTSVIWMPSAAMDVANQVERQVEDVTAMRRTLILAYTDPESVHGCLPLKEAPFTRYGRLRELWQ